MLRRNLRTIIESFGKSFKDQKNAKLKKSVKREKSYDKKETMFKKSKKVNIILKNFCWSVQEFTKLKSKNA